MRGFLLHILPWSGVIINIKLNSVSGKIRMTIIRHGRFRTAPFLRMAFKSSSATSFFQSFILQPDEDLGGDLNAGLAFE